MTEPVPNDLPPATGASETIKRITRGSQPGQGLERSLVTMISSLAAVLLAFVIVAIGLQLTGKNPVNAYQKMFEAGWSKDKMLEMLQRATPMMLAAVAVSVGFKMNLFNIGVEGQYWIAALIASVVGAAVHLPAVLHVTLILLVSMVVGMAWASIAAVLKVKRGVNEVIATIMLNYISLSVVQWLFDTWFRDNSKNDLNVKTKIIPTSGWMPELTKGLSGMFLVALFMVALYWVLVFKSRFGFRLRASGLNAGAARTSGISANRMIFISLLISGAVAGMVGMTSVLGTVHAFGTNDVPLGLGFAGIAVALLGRLHPVGILTAACLFGFLDSTASSLQIAGIPNSIVKVIQAIIVFAVVIVNEATTAWWNRRVADRTSRALTVAAAS